jgi:hypothetical protein
MSASSAQIKSVKHRSVHVNGIEMHIAEQGEGPLIVLAHGWPELWYSWRHVLPALGAEGYHAVARICAATVKPTLRRTSRITRNFSL